MGYLPAVYENNSRYVHEFDKATGLLPEDWFIKNNVTGDEFVAVYYWPAQSDKIVFTDKNLFILRDQELKNIKLSEIIKTDYFISSSDNDTRYLNHRDFKAQVNAVRITLKDDREVSFEVEGFENHVRDAFSMGKIISILKRRMKA